MPEFYNSKNGLGGGVETKTSATALMERRRKRKGVLL
jgi:hypothetical protein